MQVFCFSDKSFSDKMLTGKLNRTGDPLIYFVSKSCLFFVQAPKVVPNHERRFLQNPSNQKRLIYVYSRINNLIINPDLFHYFSPCPSTLENLPRLASSGGQRKLRGSATRAGTRRTPYSSAHGINSPSLAPISQLAFTSSSPLQGID